METEHVAVVTGHSRGLGAAIAAALLAERIHVLGIARQQNADLAKRFGASLTEVQLDLADALALERWIEGDALARFVSGSKLALLVNNAGVLEPIGPLETQDIAAVSRAATVNVAAVLMLSAAFAQATRQVADRRILHISSGAASSAYAGWSVYGATKAALDHHARAVALDHSPALRICSVAPGVIDTEMQAEVRRSTEEKFPTRQRFVDMKREGKLRSPHEAARDAVDFLLSKGFGSKAVADLRS